MNNYKIKVKSEAESKEAQELFFELDYKWQCGEAKYLNCRLDVFYILSRENGEMSYCSVAEVDFNSKNNGYSFFKTITIAELRDMVVLNRNCIDDATHENSMLSYIKLTDGWYYFDNDAKKWLKSTGGKPEYYEKLKPIEKTMKKEYLFKQISGDYKLVDHDCQGRAIEIPKLAEFAVLNGDNEINFYTGIGLEKNHFIPSAIIWQRATHPEELPFIDDEPKPLNDKYTEIEQVRQDMVNHPEHYTQGKVECIDALEAATVGKTGIEAVCVANVIKYLWRYEEKNGKEDIKKAQWYLNKLLDSID